MRAAALFLVLAASTASAAPWVIDPELRFALVYLNAPSTATKPAAPYLLHRDASKPDIDNIKYGGLLELGFPLPPIERPDGHRFLIKLYEYPAALNAALSTHRALDPFHFELVEGGRELVRWAEAREHLGVKLAVVDEGKTITLPLFALPTQDDFDSNAPFTTIYLGPDTTGVREFHKAMLAGYRAALTELAPTADRFVFVEPRRCVAGGKELCGVHVIEVLKSPMVFANWRDLPMPQDPAHVFLTSLLLVTTTELSVAPGTTLATGRTTMEWLKKTGKVLSSQLLEVGSMMREAR